MDTQEEGINKATEELKEMECSDNTDLYGDADDLEMGDEARDSLQELNSELWDKIREEKKNQPSMFVSGWEEDETGLEPGDPDNESERFLTAAEIGDLKTLKAMFENNPSLLGVRDRDHYTPLHRAAYNNQVETLRWLLSVGADPELRTEDGWTVLHSAACWGAYQIVGLLLKHGVDVNCRSNGNLTPLHLAINSNSDIVNQITTIKYLLDTPGIDMAALNKAGETPLILARRAPPEVLDVLTSYLKRP
ncbi:unnamed protein product [Bursaphelenchus xylophilus]|uniref:(pine wood nematode) hypothetical protein n=1 Tax=Bursaphelenchus xylophilus TaxID=6326 RepID=A0A1I7SM51_BURXY|nr:unnamed protein product [Bursaphelenchus xylophilus]CAG9129999.1 unnamed protein product [Bursaphelenchus xylophilus]